MKNFDFFEDFFFQQMKKARLIFWTPNDDALLMTMIARTIDNGQSLDGCCFEKNAHNRKTCMRRSLIAAHPMISNEIIEPNKKLFPSDMFLSVFFWVFFLHLFQVLIVTVCWYFNLALYRFIICAYFWKISRPFSACISDATIFIYLVSMREG